MNPDWNPKKPIVPVKPDGSMLSYPQWAGMTWMPFPPVEMSLALIGTERGRSSTVFVWADAEGKTYPMFVKDMLDLASRSVISQGWVKGTFTAAKRGQNYGIRLVDA